LWLSNAYYLNDPFDCAFLVNCCAEGIRSNEDAIKQMRQDTESKNLQSTVFIACFSERPDSILMWGHYANDHRGICVGYPLKELIEKFNCFPVLYEENLIQHTNEKTILRETLTKYIEWQYEREWRIIETHEECRGKNGILIDFVMPKEIILGCKNGDLRWPINNTLTTSDEKNLLLEIDARQLIDFARDELKTKCYQYKMCPKEFSLQKTIIRI
jgi:hypothetical protein